MHLGSLIKEQKDWLNCKKIYKGDAMIFLAGDIEGMTFIHRLTDYFHNRDDVTEDDYLILLGDVQVFVRGSGEARHTIQTLEELPLTVLFIDGNHENFDILDSIEVEEWNGGKVHYVSSKLIHLMRGQVFDIEDKKFFTLGGASSINKNQLERGITWWEEEIPTEDEIAEGWENLKQNDYAVDYVLTHTAPYEVVAALGYGADSDDDAWLTRELQRIADQIEFDEWFFGHWHMDESIENFHCLFDEVIDLAEF